jgi:GNAT superfamily N-acetyltransferase
VSIHTSAQRRPLTASRIARPVSDLRRSAAFYGELLGLRVLGGFENHEGYDGVFLALPEGGQLELTTGPAEPSPGTDEDLLVVYTDALEAVAAIGSALQASGVRRIDAANPYWNRWGQTFLDPDGYRVVVAARPPAVADDAGGIRIHWHSGPRAELRALFELAEDSAEQLDAYLELGRVLVAARGPRIVGHLQLVPTGRGGEFELKNMAVLPEAQGSGVGRALVTAAAQACSGEGAKRLLVATAAADTGNLRFYQRTGFRMLSVERDAFTPETGYEQPVMIDGVPLRDRVWLDRQL